MPHYRDTELTEKNRKNMETDHITQFRADYYPSIEDSQWNSWKWQLQNRISSSSELSRIMTLTPPEQEAFRNSQQRTPFSITPYYISVISARNPDMSLRKSVIPVADEFTVNPDESADPLTEEKHSPVPAIVHRYPDRVLFLSTLQCAVYCRYCTRARIFSQPATAINHTRHWQEGLDYISQNKKIREVIVSGGDPLMLDNNLIKGLLEKIREIPHVQIIRLGTKFPIVLPQRITCELVDMLRLFHPLILSLHVIHPDELTPEVATALGRLVDAGIIIGSQTVLLRGINDDPETIQCLMEKLLLLRVRPYALFQCDPILGSSRFRTRLEKGVEIIEHLRRNSSGYTIPHFIVDPPGGKVNLAPNSIISQNGSIYRLRNWRGTEIEYTDPHS